MHSTFPIGSRKPFVKNLLLVEGISRCGKFLMANLLNGIKSVEPVQYYGLLEQIPIWEKFGLIDTKLAKEMLQCEIDTHAYEMFIGRNFNHRKSDKSSIYNVPNFNIYIERAEKEDGEKAKERFYNSNLYNFFIVHELMSNLNIYFDIFPELKVVHVERNPISLVHSWWKRGYAERYGEDPIFFDILFETKDGSIPWYAKDWSEEYFRLSGMDRMIKSIETLQNKEQQAIKNLSEDNKKKVLVITYEQMLYNTNDVISRLSKFLNKEKFDSIGEILEQESLPSSKNPSIERDKKLKEIISVASPVFAEKLLELEKIYLSK